MKRFVRTTVSLEFQSMDTGSLAEGLHYESSRVRPGFLCHLSYEDKERGILISVEYPTYLAEARPGDYEEINAMEFLAEVHAGNVSDEALKELS